MLRRRNDSDCERVPQGMDEEEETSGSRAWGCGMAADLNQAMSKARP